MSGIPPEITSYLTRIVLERLQNPAAVSPITGLTGAVDCEMKITEASLSALIDLHSADDTATLEVFKDLSCIQVIQQACEDFRRSVKANAQSGVCRREDVAQMQEVLLNCKRFIRYKIAFL